MPARTAARSPGNVGERAACSRVAGRRSWSAASTHGGGALVELQLGRRLHDLGHDLDGAGAGSDHRHPLAGEVDAVVPLRGVESGPVGSRPSPSMSGSERNVQRARARDEELRDVLLPGRR